MSLAAARITYVGHATVLVEMDGTRVLTDPLLRTRFMHIRRVARADVEALRDVDAVLVSHLHFDHLDFPSLTRLGRDVTLVVPRGAGVFVRRHGFERTLELGRGETLRFGAVHVTATRADHPARRLPLSVRAEPLGFVLRGSRSVYFAGDTDLFDEMTDIGPVDVALLPIWGWGPGLGAGHLNPHTAAEAARRVQARLVIPIHWATYFPFHLGLRRPPAFIEAPGRAFAKRMADTSPDIEVRLLAPGSATTL
jgi:L-ascorbate metabolism protein UlaG (beta-lactamase superfamily)